MVQLKGTVVYFDARGESRTRSLCTSNSTDAPWAAAPAAAAAAAAAASAAAASPPPPHLRPLPPCRQRYLPHCCSLLPCAAKAEAIRLTLAAAGVEFENKFLAHADLATEVKGNPADYPFGQVPRCVCASQGTAWD